MRWWRRNKADNTVQHRERADKRFIKKQLRGITSLVNSKGQPNINEIWQIAKDIEAIKLNLKNFGYELALEASKGLEACEINGPRVVGLSSKASTQQDLESDWAAYWLDQLRTKVIYHRKLWEFAYVLQALWENDKIKAGRRGIGFGCGTEPIPSYLTSKGVEVTITDLPPNSEEYKKWHDTEQHTTNIKKSHHSGLVDSDTFERLAALRYVDMNDIPQDITGYDFCWSICALEHVGSIKKGLDFIENSLNTLVPGGVAVHTTEYNFANDDRTIDNWVTVLFQRKHFQEIHDRLTLKGHRVAALDFSVGSNPLDRFIDLPPYSHENNEFLAKQWPAAPHLKLTIDGFASTCFGMLITKAG